MSRDTVGKIAYDRLLKEPDSVDPIAIERELQQDYVQELINCIDAHKNTFDGDFYLIVITKKEPLMANVLRNYFMARSSCPTPDYDQSVFCYERKHEQIVYLWSLPSKDTCELFRDNALRIDPKEHELLHFILKFYDGTLLSRSKELNKESKDSNIIVN